MDSPAYFEHQELLACRLNMMSNNTMGFLMFKLIKIKAITVSPSCAIVSVCCFFTVALLVD